MVVLCFALVRGSDYGSGMLVRTAVATGVGLLGATLLAAFVVHQEAGAVVAPLSLLRVGLALAAGITAGRALPDAHVLVTLPYALVVALVFVIVLVATRELGKDDLRMVTRVLGRKG